MRKEQFTKLVLCTARPVSTTRPVSIVRQFAPKIAQTSGAIRPIYPRINNVRPRGSYSPIKRSYYTKPAFRPKDLKQDVKTFGVQNMTTAGIRAVVNTGKDKIDTNLKKSRWVWMPKGNYLDHVSKDSGSFMLKKDHAVVDSGCSSHMTGNKYYLSDYEDYNGGFVAFGSDPKGGKITDKGKIKTANLDFDDVYFVDELNFKLLDESQVVLRAPKKDDVYSLDLKNIVPSGGLENQLNHNVKIIRCDNGTEFKNHAMNEFCAKKGIKREFSVARTPQQNGVAERKNRTLIEAARTMLADSLLPIPFWAEAVNTACYVLNRVLVTKPQNKTPYELLIGNSPSISFMRPFGCPLTILNTLDSLGKFDGKSDEGYLLGYSTTSKAFRVYNKRTKRVEENLHIDFLEDQPNVAGTGPNWMFDLDFLTNSMNYIPVSVENQVNVDAGTQDSYVAGSSGKDKGPTQEYILLPLQPHRTRIPVEDVAPAAHEKPSESSPKDNDVQDSEDVADKEGQHQMTEDEQVLHDELEKMIAQEVVAKALDDATRQAFEEEKRNIAYVSAASTPTGANDGESSFVYLGGQIPIDASTLPNANLSTDPNMPDLEDDSDVFPNEGIFSGAYDDEDKGAEADFNNIDNTIDVSPIPTLIIHKDHPKAQILRDPKSAVQTRRKIQKASSSQQALVNYIYKQNRTNHKDHQNCLLACFLSQEEPKKISQALEDESWVEAMLEELLQFQLQKVWILVDLPYRKKALLVLARIHTSVQGSQMLFMVYNKLPDAWYETLFSFPAENDFDAQRFHMSSMGELTFFLGLQVKQQPNGIFISQDKQKKFDQSFIPIDSAEDERQIREMNKKTAETDTSKKRKSGLKVKRIFKKRKTDSYVEEKEKLKSFLNVEPHEDKAINYEVLQTRVIKAGGSSRWIKTFSEMVKLFDRMDLVEIHSLVMKRFATTTPKDDGLWKNQEEWSLLSWEFHENYGVYVLRLEDGTEINMLAGRRYPLTKDMLKRMLDLRLTVISDDDVALDLLRFMKAYC
ncbi:ribonuclease H-like domain-containing protein [Tanacetum coccineum]